MNLNGTSYGGLAILASLDGDQLAKDKIRSFC